ncbi:acyl-CoA thioesterase [Aliiglaciecola sp. 3_MG-2023]|nr:acyl-CoA thioesterase [Aliiglaciecola sp. 3_MG-2023]MDO6695052.1 acyl-CoA thioesterase [Aliiglaciecola sp. 3_MG-2023]
MEAQVEISIPFHDIDVMRIAWHGHYVKYLEIARCALFDKMAYNFPEMEQSGYAWPVIDLHIRYASALSFQQQIIVKAKIVEWENRLKINYQIVDKESGKRLTKASTVQVAVEIESKEMMFESPPILFEKLGLSK